jgi:hypothetical protein
MRVMVLPLLLVVILIAGAAVAQPGFRVTHEVGRTTPTHVEVKGVVYNESRSDAADVSVTTEALDANGKVLARGITYVSGRVPEHGSAAFTAKVPVVPGIASYRVTVTAFKFMPAFQGS